MDSNWTNLIIETERAVKLLEPKLQNRFRMRAAEKLNKIRNSNTQYNAKQKRQTYIPKSILYKFVKENAIVVPADNGKTVVIINSDEFKKKTPKT